MNPYNAGQDTTEKESLFMRVGIDSNDNWFVFLELNVRNILKIIATGDWTNTAY